MTEQEFLTLKERLTIAARVRGRIAAQKKKVAEWTGTEHRLQDVLKKEWAKIKIIQAIDKLKAVKKEFENL